MSNFSPYQGPTHSNLSHYFWGFIFSIIILFLFVTSVSAYIKNIRMRNYALSINNEIIAIQKENKCLEEQVYSIVNDSIYREAIIRKELKMCQADEIVIKK